MNVSLRCPIPGRALLPLALVLCLVPLCLSRLSRANAPGTVLYSLTDPSEFLAYARVIRLSHAGAADGTLLATFEHWHSGTTPTSFVIKRSRDDGRSWQTLSTVSDGETGPGHPWPILWQPSLFELPRALGRYPAGTLLLAGNVCPPGVTETHFQLWRSPDQGRHWSYASTFQTGGSVRPQRGIWEPFLALTRRGELVCYFSDERQSQAHSQFLGHLTSPDGGDTWRAEVEDVASPHQPDRPGMATVARLPSGAFLMAYEVCGPHGCEVRLKTSADGETWGQGPEDLGSRPETADGRSLVGSPYLVWARGGGPQGRLLLAAHAENRTRGGQAPETGQVLFLNTSGGSGPWSWMPAPLRPVAAPAGNTNPGYSPCLLPSLDGRSVRLTVPSGGSPLGRIRTQSAPAGLLPYRAPFAEGSDAGWLDDGGEWTAQGGVYRNTARGLQDRAIAGSTGWTDYTLTADLNLASAGHAGLLVRVSARTADSEAARGEDTNALQGYAARLSSDTGTLSLVREADGGSPLATIPVSGGVSVNTWYRLSVQSVGPALTATVRRADGRGSTTTLRASDARFAAGAVGVGTGSTPASFRNLRVAPDRVSPGSGTPPSHSRPAFRQ